LKKDVAAPEVLDKIESREKTQQKQS